jgi:hypothetical protein
MLRSHAHRTCTRDFFKMSCFLVVTRLTSTFTILVAARALQSHAEILRRLSLMRLFAVVMVKIHFKENTL